MPYDNERVEKAVLDLLQDSIEAALDAVEAKWEDVDPLDLPDVVTWFEGFSPTVLERDSVEFPFLAVMALERTPAGGETTESEWGFQSVTVSVVIGFVVFSMTETDVNKLAHRYAEAIISILQAQQSMAGGSQTKYEPTARLSPAMKQGIRLESMPEVPSETGYIEAGEIEVPIVTG